MSEPDPGGFYTRTVRMFAACLDEGERQTFRERFRANSTPLKLQMEILGDYLDRKTKGSPVPTP